MEPAMKFQSGTYYVGDPGFVLPSEDLRMLFAQAMHGGLKSGPRELVASKRFKENRIASDFYRFPPTPHKAGTHYEQDKKGSVLDWG
jgi:hypothetical protein